MEKLSTLKDLPLWALIGLTIIVGLVSWSPGLQVVLPAAQRVYLPLAVTVLGVLTACSLSAKALSLLMKARADRIARDRDRLTKVYRPMTNLFLDGHHVTVYELRLAPYFRDRLKNAFEALRLRRPWKGLGAAWRALGDRRMSETAEVEHGGDFPLSEIVAIAKANPEADKPLLDLIGQATRARMEDPLGDGRLTAAELALHGYIHRRHAELARRV